MFVHSVRLGFATNSSSTHSIVRMVEPKKFKKETDLDGDFGQKDFTLLSRNSKLDYLGTLLRNSFLDKKLPVHIVDTILQAWTGRRNNNGCDHNSSFVIPADYPTKQDTWSNKDPDMAPSEEFFKKLQQQVLRDDVAILGGSDNSDKPHPLLKYGKQFAWHKGLMRLADARCDEWICRKDCRDGAEWWVLFNRRSGMKLRISFTGAQPLRAVAPELVDLKITERCDENCKHCYEDSKANGRRADAQFVRDLLATFAKLKVFEVSFGGGDPLSHPEFWNFLAYARSLGIIPSFSTRDWRWLDNDVKRKAAFKICGAVGFSINSAQELGWLFSTLNQHYNDVFGDEQAGIKIHVIPELLGDIAFKKLIETANILGARDVLLLGFKSMGRAKNMQPKKLSRWAVPLRKTFINVGVDTLFAKRYESAIKRAFHAGPVMYETKEGMYSCAIDAVKRTIAKSSYDPKHIPFCWPKEKHDTVEDFMKRMNELEQKRKNKLLSLWEKL